MPNRRAGLQICPNRSAASRPVLPSVNSSAVHKHGRPGRGLIQIRNVPDARHRWLNQVPRQRANCSRRSDSRESRQGMMNCLSCRALGNCGTIYSIRRRQHCPRRSARSATSHTLPASRYVGGKLDAVSLADRAYFRHTNKLAYIISCIFDDCANDVAGTRNSIQYQ
jgi:hypothetical protein